MSIRSLAYQSNKAYLSAITVTSIFQSLTYKMTAKTSWHRYGTKLRHGVELSHDVYLSLRFIDAARVVCGAGST